MYDETPKHRWLYAAIGLVMVLLIFGAYRRYRAEALMRKVRDLQQAMRTAPPEQRGQKAQELRTTMQAMSPAQRERLMADGRKRFEQEMIAYTQLSQVEKVKRLDEQINREQQFMQKRPANVNFAAGPRPQRPANNSAEDRERRRRQRLDASTPEFRAAMDQFRKDVENRRRQRGLPPRK